MEDLTPATADIEIHTTNGRFPKPGLISIFRDAEAVRVYVQEGQERRFRNIAVFTVPVAVWDAIVNEIPDDDSPSR